MSDPARHLNLAGASNFSRSRRLSRLAASGDRASVTLRSNHLGHLTDDDIYADVARHLGVRSAFDFRGALERAEARCAA